ncbi:MAG: aldo/keto reductase, partial [bacterium]|nr:aldo/keto reductase [bacterium]
MAELETRRLGRTEMKPKALGLGCAFLGSPQRVTDEEAVEAVRHAIDLGINFVDTSAAYGGGHSERRVGLALEDGYREKVYLQTKAGT